MRVRRVLLPCRHFGDGARLRGSGRTVEGILRGAVAAGGTQERGTDGGGRGAQTRRGEASAAFRRRIGLVGRESIGEGSRARAAGDRGAGIS